VAFAACCGQRRAIEGAVETGVEGDSTRCSDPPARLARQRSPHARRHLP